MAKEKVKTNYKLQRFLEMLPGSITWLVILFPIWGAFLFLELSLISPSPFLVFWLYRSFQSGILGIRGYVKIRRSEKTDWKKKYLEEKNGDSLSWNKIKHVIVIPNYNESVEIIAATLERLTKQKNISKEQLVIALAMEGRAEGSDKRAQELLKRFKGKFGRLEAIMHPDGIVGEIRGKAANEAWAAKKIKIF